MYNAVYNDKRYKHDEHIIPTVRNELWGKWMRKMDIDGTKFQNHFMPKEVSGAEVNRSIS